MPSIVDRLSLWSGAAGLIPLPLVDMAAVGGVQLYMLRRLSEIYEIPFSENLGKSILSSLAGAVIPATTATTAASVMKGVPIVETAIGALTMPAVGAGATWIIGKVFIKLRTRALNADEARHQSPDPLAPHSSGQAAAIGSLGILSAVRSVSELRPLRL